MENKNKFNKIRDLIFIILLLVAIIFIMIFNYTVDAYQIFRKTSVIGFNNIKIHKLSSKRSILYPEIKWNKNNKNIAFVGSCLLDNYGLNIDNVLYATIPMVTTKEIYEVIQNIHKIAPNIKNFYIGLAYDELWNDTNREITDTLPNLESEKLTYKDIVTLFFSWNTTKYSIETLKESIKNKGEQILYIYPFKEIAKKEYKKDLPNTPFEELKKIVNYAKLNNLDITVYYSPIHVSKKVHIYEKSQWQNNLSFKRKLADIIPFYDYSLFNEYNAFPLDEKSRYFVDNLHITKKYNNIVEKDIEQ